MKYSILIGLVFTFILTGGYSQSNFTQYNLNNMPQAQYLNPAFRSTAKFGFSIAPISNLVNFSAVNSGFAIKDVLETRPDSDSLDFTIDNAIGKLKSVNYFDVDMQNELFGLVVTTDKMSVNVSVSHKLNSSFSYPKDLLALAYYGNGSNETIGKRLAFDGLGYNFTSYLEFGLGVNRVIGKKGLVIGAKLKYLAGLANFETEQSQFGIYTDPKTFALTVDGAAKINTSNLTAFYDDGVNIDIREAINGSHNSGFGIDLGATYDLSDKIHLSASIIDLGYIKWTENTESYKIDAFEFNYNGIDINKYLEDSAKVIDEIVDSLENIANVITTNGSYTTALKSKIYLSGNYRFTEQFNVSATWYNSIYSKKYRTALSIGANYQFKHWFAVSGNYSIHSYGGHNLGLGLSLRGGPFQVYAMSDALFALLRPEHSKRLHFNFGLSFQVGKTKGYEKKKGV